LKQEVYQIAGSNIENLGSDLETKIKEESSKHEVAWHGMGTAPGMHIWRIEKFHVKPWPQNRYGTFYSGDSYILLNTYLTHDDNELHHDLHFWLGQHTTLDEAGTAAYKTVELDTYLHDAPIQHREVEGYESPLFLSYFPNGVFVLEGGVETGFFHVVPETYTPRLLQVKGCFKHVHTRQVALSRDSLNDGDVFILDLGNKIFQWNGANSRGFEKHKASEVVMHLKERRGFHIDLVVIDQDSPTSDDDVFWTTIGGKGKIKHEDPNSDLLEKKKTDIKLYKLSDSSGEVTYTFVAEGHRGIKPEMFTSDDVYILDKGYIVYVWIGSGASKEEKRQAMGKAQKFIQEFHGNAPLPITIVPESSDPRVVPKLLKEKN